MQGSVGETEDENEGSTSITDKKIKNLKSDPESSNRIMPSFPSSMPIIPMPTSNFDIKPFDTSNVNNVASINVAAAAAAAAMLEPNSAFFQPTAAAMAAAAVASSSPPTSTTNFWNFPYHSAYSQTTSQMFPNGSTKSGSFTGNEFINSMAAASSFPLSHTSKHFYLFLYYVLHFNILDWMAPNYSSSTMLNMNMIAPGAYGFPTPTSNANGTVPTSTTGLDFTNTNGYYPSMPPTVSIAAAYDFYNSQNYYSSSTNPFWDPLSCEKRT